MILKCYYYIKNMRLFYIFLHFSVKAMKCAPLKQSCCITNLQSLHIIAFKVALAATLYKSTRPKFHFNQSIILDRCNVSLPPAIQFRALLFILADHIIYIRKENNFKMNLISNLSLEGSYIYNKLLKMH